MKMNPLRWNVQEVDIEDWLYENPGAVEFSPETRVEKWIARQYSVPSGIVDLIGVGTNGECVVVEVKNVPFSSDALTQVCRYAHDIKAAIGIFAEKRGLVRIVIGVGDVSTRILYEANALNVILLSFNATLSLSISGRWHFQDDAMAAREQTIKEMAVSNEMRDLQLYMMALSAKRKRERETSTEESSNVEATDGTEESSKADKEADSEGEP